jgi:hypothetical protein
MARARGLRPARARRPGRMGRQEMKPAWLIAGVRTPFARVDGALRKLDAVALVGAAKAMAAQLPRGDRLDLGRGTVAPNSVGATSRARSRSMRASTRRRPLRRCSRARPAWWRYSRWLNARRRHRGGLCGGVEI